jgi:Flp pilus assembly protein TadG
MSRFRSRIRDQQGSAVADFVLVMLVLVPLFLGILQLALIHHVRNTLTAAATEGARYGATIDHSPENGAMRTRAQITDTLSARFAGEVRAGLETINGAPVVVVNVEADIPPLGLWGPSVHVSAAGHALKESDTR